MHNLTSQEIETRIAELLADEGVSTELVDLMIEIDFRDAFSGEIQFQFGEQAREFSDQLDYKRGQCWVLVMDASTHFLRSRHKQALEGFMEARKAASAIEDERLKAILNNGMAEVHKTMGNYESAFG